MQAQLEILESRIAANPKDVQATRRLVTLLDSARPQPMPAGAFGRAQARISSELGPDWQVSFLDSKQIAKAYSQWIGTLKSHHIQHAVPIGQIFSGKILKIKGQPAFCGENLKFFKETKVIPGQCHDCYKVQILPETLEAMFQTYFLLLNLELPGDNARKCMIELRDGIKYPYKGYIYCESVTEVKACLTAFQNLQSKFGLIGIHSKISHGCSEYGQEYPAFKYSDSTVSPGFETPEKWAEIERRHFARLNLQPPQKTSNTKPVISLRDVFGFCTWVKYAELIGDKTSGIFQTANCPDLPAQFLRRVKLQANRRQQELKDLAATHRQ